MSDRALLDEYHNLLRSDFAAFLVRAFAELHPKQELVMAPHIAVMASRFSDVRNGRIRRLVINVPPRSLKSFIGSVAGPAWLLGHDASTTIICASYAQDLADDLARDCRTLMLSEWYRGLFSRTRLTAQKPALQELVTTVGGYRLATSVGGVLTGRGADIIIIDDPLKPEEAMSDTQRQATNAWYDGTLVSRLNDQRHGVIVLIMQRLHEADLTGHVLEQEAWEHLCLPAIAEQDEVHRYMTAWGLKTYCRRAGDLLHPERLPAERLEELKHTMGSYFFAAQFQQRPAPAGGGMVKPAWFKRYTANDQPERFDRIVQSWDTASKVAELADYSSARPGA